MIRWTKLVRLAPRNFQFFSICSPPVRCIAFGHKSLHYLHFRNSTSFRLGEQFCILHSPIIDISSQNKLYLPCARCFCSASKSDAKTKNIEEDQDAGEGIQKQQKKLIFDLKVDTSEKAIPSKTRPLSRHDIQFQTALVEAPMKSSFCEVLEKFKARDRTRRGHMEFLKTALNYMDVFGLEKDLEVYNRLLDVFPRGRFENKTLFDAIWAKQHPQVFLALDILTKMEENVVKPSQETHDICYEVFGRASQPVQKCRRIAYWFTKLDEMFPHPLPVELPDNEIALSTIAMERMAKEGVHVTVYQVCVFKSKDMVEDCIIGAQSDSQKDTLASYDATKPLYVEGPFFMWLRRLKRHYYILRADVAYKEQDDEGMILAVCIMQAADHEKSLKTWIASLQEENPQLAQINIIFNLQLQDKSNV